jgi:uncharacterized membrane protein
MNYIIQKLQEPTTYIGVLGLLGAFGVSIAPELSDAIITACVSLASLIAVIMNEK